jgi:hypothetical protein
MEALIVVKANKANRLIKEIKKAVANLSLSRKGKLKLKTARELYNEL